MAHFPTTRGVSFAASHNQQRPAGPSASSSIARGATPDLITYRQVLNEAMTSSQALSLQQVIKPAKQPLLTPELAFKNFYQQARSSTYSDYMPRDAKTQILQDFGMTADSASWEVYRKWADSAESTFRHRRSIQRAAERDPDQRSAKQIKSDRWNKWLANAVARDPLKRTAAQIRAQYTSRHTPRKTPLAALDPAIFTAHAAFPNLPTEAAAEQVRQALADHGIRVRLESVRAHMTGPQLSLKQPLIEPMSVPNLLGPANQAETDHMLQEGGPMMERDWDWQADPVPFVEWTGQHAPRNPFAEQTEYHAPFGEQMERRDPRNPFMGQTEYHAQSGEQMGRNDPRDPFVGQTEYHAPFGEQMGRHDPRNPVVGQTEYQAPFGEQMGRHDPREPLVPHTAFHAPFRALTEYPHPFTSQTGYYDEQGTLYSAYSRPQQYERNFAG